MTTVVIDDDPTGTQAMSDVSVILDWEDEAAWATVRPGDRAVHVLTNSRAHPGVQAARLVASAATAARARFPRSRVVLRGDSTLRAHLWEEYSALRSVLAPGREDVPLMLVPALPSAGRVTIGGVHLLERDGTRIPLDATEYATDGELAYSTADLGLWAQERSAGRLAADGAIRVALARLRRDDGAAAVAAALAEAAGLGRAVVVVPDAENEADLEVIAAGLRMAETAGTEVIVRCAPAFVATLTGVRAGAAASLSEGVESALVICGSFVPATTAQITRVQARWPGAMVPASVSELAGEGWETSVARISEEARGRIERHGLAAVVTDRIRDPAHVSATSQRRIAAALAQVAGRVRADVVIAKGGITSAVTALEGMGAHAARVLGPIKPGVALWRLADGREYVVVPGNVGGAELLVDLLAPIMSPAGAPSPAPARSPSAALSRPSSSAT